MGDHTRWYPWERVTDITISPDIMYAIKLFIASNSRPIFDLGPLNKTDPVNYVESSDANNTIRDDFNDDEYIFDRTDIRAIFITLYTLVFCCCFFGKFQSSFKQNVKKRWSVCAVPMKVIHIIRYNCNLGYPFAYHQAKTSQYTVPQYKKKSFS